ncbi:MAG: hypothetical protein WCP31_01745 [Chloroflexales bacterium]
MHTQWLADLLAERIATVTILPGGELRPDAPPNGAILAGAFNPLHRGHERMAAAAAKLTGLPVAFELALLNADKGFLPHAEIERRVAQFAGRHTLVLSCAPLFVQKAALYPGRTFVLGYDTAVRLLAPRYYGGDSGLHAALTTLRQAGCHLLVAGRLAAGRFATLADLALPAGYADMFTALPAAQFREDISSTELRKP